MNAEFSTRLAKGGGAPAAENFPQAPLERSNGRSFSNVQGVEGVPTPTPCRKLKQGR